MGKQNNSVPIQWVLSRMNLEDTALKTNTVWFLFSLFFFWPSHTACGTLNRGMEPSPPAADAGSLNHRTTRAVPGTDSVFYEVLRVVKSHRGRNENSSYQGLKEEESGEFLFNVFENFSSTRWKIMELDSGEGSQEHISVELCHKLVWVSFVLVFFFLCVYVCVLLTVKHWQNKRTEWKLLVSCTYDLKKGLKKVHCYHWMFLRLHKTI